MSPLRTMLCLIVTSIVAAPSAACAHELNHEAERRTARRELELAKLDLRHYWQIEYPRERRHLAAQIELTEAEIRDLRERLRAYRPHSWHWDRQRLLIPTQNLEMCLREAELRLRDLWAERTALSRLHSERWRILEMRVHEARLRVAEIESTESQDSDAPTRRI